MYLSNVSNIMLSFMYSTFILLELQIYRLGVVQQLPKLIDSLYYKKAQLLFWYCYFKKLNWLLRLHSCMKHLASVT